MSQDNNEDTQIWVKKGTRERILEAAKKSETYDEFLNRALDVLENKEKIERKAKYLGKVV